MGEEASAVIVGVLVTVLGLLGLVLAAGALDIEMSVFGYGLTGFAVLFIFHLIKRHYDRAEAARND
jgi:hypothetical protein